MKRLPIHALFIATVLVSITASEFIIDRWDWTSFYRKHYALRADMLEDEAAFADAYFKADSNDDRLAAVLDTRRKLGGVDFWVLYRQGAPIKAAVHEGELSAMRFEFADSPSAAGPKMDDARAYAYVARGLPAGRQLVVGLRYDEGRFLREEFNKRKGFIFLFLVNLSLPVIAAFFFYFRDIAKLLRQLSSRGRAFARSSPTRSREAEVLARGLLAFETQAEELARENRTLHEEILPSLRAELASGRTPPYEFDCVLVRTDINGFSSIFNSHPVEEFMATVDGFFAELSRAVAKHGGLMHEFVGDEAIYYFKDEDVGDSTAAALGAIREAGLIAQRIDASIRAKRGYSFSVKSSLAHGRLRYGRFLRGHGLAGAPLIETVRILSNVRERDGNVAVFDARHAEAARAVARVSGYGSFDLKGFAGARELVKYEGHLRFEDVLSRDERAQERALPHLRSDADLAGLIRTARAAAQMGRHEDALRLLSWVRVRPVYATDGEPKRELARWIPEAMRRLEPRSTGTADCQADARVLSSLMAAMRAVIPPSVATAYDLELLRKGASLFDLPRVAANALEALAVFDLEAAIAFAEKVTTGADPRLEAAAWSVRGRRELDRAVIRGIRRMLRAKEGRCRASGAYAIGEIAAHFKTTDAVYMNAQIDFVDLLHSLPELALRDREARSQAIRAIWRSGDEAALRRLRELAEASGDQEFAREAMSPQLRDSDGADWVVPAAAA